MNDSGDHPRSHVDFECEFAAAQLSRRRPGKILDIGSYRVFVLGLVANCPVTSLDVRARIPIVAGETVVTGDAKRIELPDRSVDCVLSLCAVEHFGLGRYGDAFDPAADRKAIAEIRRLLRPGGLLLLSTTVTRGRPTLSFNAHRIYTLELIHEMTAGMTPADEAFFSTSRCTPCRHSEVTTDPGKWDVYCGCLVKDPQ
jgi:SAM-dependent methyltransferase